MDLPYIVLCSWCKTRPIRVAVPNSHGICVGCKDQQLAEFRALPTATFDEIKCCHGIPANQFCIACEAEV